MTVRGERVGKGRSPWGVVWYISMQATTLGSRKEAGRDTVALTTPATGRSLLMPSARMSCAGCFQTTMFSASLQPPIVSLFSSTGSNPLALWAAREDASLPADSFVCLLQDASSTPAPPPPAKLISPLALDQDTEHGRGEGYTLSQTVLHLQSPTLRTTFVQCPSIADGVLGMKHPWIHLQVRNMGREWSFEVGVVDRAGREGVIRLSTFQVIPLFNDLSPKIYSFENAPSAGR